MLGLSGNVLITMCEDDEGEDEDGDDQLCFDNQCKEFLPCTLGEIWMSRNSRSPNFSGSENQTTGTSLKIATLEIEYQDGSLLCCSESCGANNHSSSNTASILKSQELVSKRVSWVNNNAKKSMGKLEQLVIGKGFDG